MKSSTVLAFCASILAVTASPYPSPRETKAATCKIVTYDFDAEASDNFLRLDNLTSVNPATTNASAAYEGLNATSLPNVGFSESGFAFFYAQNGTTFKLLSLSIQAKGTNEAIIEGFKPGSSEAQINATFLIGGPDNKQMPQNLTSYQEFQGLDAMTVQVRTKGEEEQVPFIVDNIAVLKDCIDSPY